MTILFVADIADTAIKGTGYMRALGPAYYTRSALYIVLSLAAIKIKDERFHAGLAILATLTEIALILKSYMTLS
jgi:hypothetical protein